MKIKNTPQRKLLRKLRAENKDINDYKKELEEARNIRTKKCRMKK